MRSLPVLVRLVVGIASCFLLGTLPLSSKAVTTSSIMIGEVQWSGSSSSTADEWIELWNVGSEDISLMGYQLEGASNEPLSFTAEQHIPPHQTFLIANYPTTDTRTLLTIEPQMVTSSLSLNNSSLHLQLFNPQRTLIDEMGDGNKPSAGSSSPLHISMIRDLSSVTSSWINATNTANLRDTSMDRGTPGVCDGCKPSELTDSSDSSDGHSSSPLSALPQENLSTSSTASAELAATSTIPFSSSTSSAESRTELESMITSSTNSSVDHLAQPTSTSETTIQYASTTSNDSSTTMTSTELSTTTNSSPPVQQNEPTPLPTVSSNASASIAAAIVPVRVTHIVATSTSPPLQVSLNELFPAPQQGQGEWIELATNRPLVPAELIGWSVENNRQMIFRFTSTTVQQTRICGNFMLIQLKGSRLKNSGDEIRLKRVTGALMEVTRYPKINKGSSWSRWPDHTGIWKQEVTMSPCAPNIQPLLANNGPTNNVSSSEAPDEDNEQEDVDEEVTMVTETHELSQSHETTPAPLPSVSSTDVALISNTSSTNSVAKTKDVLMIRTPSTKKTTPRPSAKTSRKAKPSPLPALIPFENLYDMSPNVRVRLTGIIGTQPGLLSSKQFVLQTEDGRGLLVTGNNHQLSPPFGSLVELSGTLRVQDEGIRLSMLSADRWRLLKKDRVAQTRTVELLAPSLEDQWSLVHVTGTIKEVNRTSFTFEADGITLNVSVRPVVQYRAERLKKGDLVAVKGLLDRRTEQIKILPRTTSDIQLIQHPEIRQAPLPLATSASLPPWMPIGVAGMTIAGIHGFKKFRKVREEKRLKAALERVGDRWEDTGD